MGEKPLLQVDPLTFLAHGPGTQGNDRRIVVSDHLTYSFILIFCKYLHLYNAMSFCKYLHLCNAMSMLRY